MYLFFAGAPRRHVDMNGVSIRLLPRRLFILRFCMFPCSSDYIINLSAAGRSWTELLLGLVGLVVERSAEP